MCLHSSLDDLKHHSKHILCILVYILIRIIYNNKVYLKHSSLLLNTVTPEMDLYNYYQVRNTNVN